MRNVRFVRAVMALALASPVALSSSAALAQDTSYISESQSLQARAEMMERFGVADLEPGKYLWAPEIPASGDTRIVISLSDQMGYVYRAGQLVGVTTVSSGKEGADTPTGVFPILQKNKDHRSNKYNSAPMPYMQRLNWYGVALHGGHNPGYPASHGCVRLPMKFAAKLFQLTRTGTPVIIEA